MDLAWVEFTVAMAKERKCLGVGKWLSIFVDWGGLRLGAATLVFFFFIILLLGKEKLWYQNRILERVGKFVELWHDYYRETVHNI